MTDYAPSADKPASRWGDVLAPHMIEPYEALDHRRMTPAIESVCPFDGAAVTAMVVIERLIRAAVLAPGPNWRP